MFSTRILPSFPGGLTRFQLMWALPKTAYAWILFWNFKSEGFHRTPPSAAGPSAPAPPPPVLGRYGLPAAWRWCQSCIQPNSHWCFERQTWEATNRGLTAQRIPKKDRTWAENWDNFSLERLFAPAWHPNLKTQFILYQFILLTSLGIPTHFGANFRKQSAVSSSEVWIKEDAVVLYRSSSGDLVKAVWFLLKKNLLSSAP